MKVNHDRRRERVEKMIDDDPWTVVIYREGRTPDDADSTISITGRIFPAGAQGFGRSFYPVALMGENGIERYRSVLVMPWDTARPPQGAQVKAIHQESGITRYFTVAFARQVASKWEVELDEKF